MVRQEADAGHGETAEEPVRVARRRTIPNRRAAMTIARCRARLFRQGKAIISRDLAEISKRIGTTAETWQAWRENLSEGRLLVRFPDGNGTFGLAASYRRAGTQRSHPPTRSAPGHQLVPPPGQLSMSVRPVRGSTMTSFVLWEQNTCFTSADRAESKVKLATAFPVTPRGPTAKAHAIASE
jgi:hypothetical protein